MGQFVVSARKYRPRRFDEVVGQDHVTQTLKNALKTDQLAHAFLFCGPRGIGKTTCARILAKVLNCESPTEDKEPCNECDSCRSFAENSSFNVIELDAASNNSVEHIRSLIDQVRFQPQKGQYKVFIIDEVHMLSTQAFNAFLKTLEEPPPYAIFILATTEKHKIIPTILSRCQVYDFKRIQVRDMVEQLKKICEQEDIDADPEALHIIAQKADGALRDALSIFDRLANYSHKKISYEDTISNLNVLDYDYYFRVVDALLMEDLGQVWQILDDVLSHGFEGNTFMLGLAEHSRNLLVCQDDATHNLLEIGEKLKAKYIEQAKSCRKDFLLNLLHLANECDVNYRMARNKRLHIEITLAKMAYMNRQSFAAENTGTEKKEEKKTSSQSLTQAAGKAEKPTGQNQTEGKKAGTTQVAKEGKSEPPVEQGSRSEENKKSEHNRTTQRQEQSRKSTKSSTPTLPSLESMDKRIQEVLQKDPEKNDNLDMKEVQAIWDKECNEVQSPSVRTILENTQLHVEGKKLIAVVGSNMSRSILQQEKDLIHRIREALNCPDMTLETHIDPNLMPTEDKEVERPLTVKEKYNKLLEANPRLKEFKERFNLRVDFD